MRTVIMKNIFSAACFICLKAKTVVNVIAKRKTDPGYCIE